MKHSDSLDRQLSKLAATALHRTEFESFRSDVWREIRHRQAIKPVTKNDSLWPSLFFDFGTARLAFSGACVALAVGVILTMLAMPEVLNSRLAAQTLDLGVFSQSATGLPSNFVALRK